MICMWLLNFILFPNQFWSISDNSWVKWCIILFVSASPSIWHHKLIILYITTRICVCVSRSILTQNSVSSRSNLADFRWFESKVIYHSLRLSKHVIPSIVNFIYQRFKAPQICNFVSQSTFELRVSINYDINHTFVGLCYAKLTI